MSSSDLKNVMFNLNMDFYTLTDKDPVLKLILNKKAIFALAKGDEACWINSNLKIIKFILE